MKKDGIQTRNRKLASKGKKKRGSVVDFFSPFVNATSDRLPFAAAAYSNLSNTSNSPYGAISAPVNGPGGSYSRYGDLSNTAAMTQYYSGMAGQMTSQFMAAAAQQAATSSQNPTSMHINGNGNMYSSVVVGGGVSGNETPTINDHTSSSLSSPLGCSGGILGNTTSSSAAAAAAAAASFAAFGPSSMSMQAAAVAGVGSSLT